MQSTTSEEESKAAREAPDTGEQASRQPVGELGELKQRLDLLNEQVKNFIKERPVACLVGAVALGYFVARMARRRS
jgi:hypothetical protein